MKNRTDRPQLRIFSALLLVTVAIGASLAGGCSNEPPKTEATPAAATGAVPPPAPGGATGPGAPPSGAVAGGGVGQRINK